MCCWYFSPYSFLSHTEETYFHTNKNMFISIFSCDFVTTFPHRLINTFTFQNSLTDCNGEGPAGTRSPGRARIHFIWKEKSICLGTDLNTTHRCSEAINHPLLGHRRAGSGHCGHWLYTQGPGRARDTSGSLPSGGYSIGIKSWVTQLEAGDILHVRREGQSEPI